MSLSCGCDFELDGDGWAYEVGSDFTTTPIGRRKRCCSCKELIGMGADAVMFWRFRQARSDFEERFHGEHVYLAPWWMCEECGGLFYSLEALGYCIWLGDGDSMKENARQHAEMHNPEGPNQ